MPVVPDFTTFENWEADVSSDKWGFATIDIVYYANDEEQALLLLAEGRECPLVESGMLLTAKFTFGTLDIEESIYTVRLHWKGVMTATHFAKTEVNYSPRGDTEPIQTHPRFYKFGGNWGARQNGAEFDKNGRFTRFARQFEGAINPKAGLTSFYSPSLTVSDKRVMDASKVTTIANVFNVGKIEEPEVELLPQIPADAPGLPEDAKRNYLLSLVEIEDLSNGYVFALREWMLSGPWGWDSDIYDYADTGDAI